MRWRIIFSGVRIAKYKLISDLHKAETSQFLMKCSADMGFCENRHYRQNIFWTKKKKNWSRSQHHTSKANRYLAKECYDFFLITE